MGEDSAGRTYFVELEGLNESLEDNEMADGSSVVSEGHYQKELLGLMEHEEINTLPIGLLLNPLQLRSTVALGLNTSYRCATHSCTSEQPLMSEKNILG